LYVSHHPNGTTYFFNDNNNNHEADDDDNNIPQETEWQPSLCVGPEEILTLQWEEEEDPTTTASNTTVASLAVVFPIRSDADGADAAVGNTIINNQPSKKYLLYTNQTCPFAQQVHILLDEWNLNKDVERRFVDIFAQSDPQFATDYHTAYPSQTQRPSIPLLVVASSSERTTTSHTYCLAESSIIMEYLAEEEGEATTNSNSNDEDDAVHHALSMPDSSMDGAKIRLFVHAVQREVLPCIRAILRAAD
jgi:hypothetical protein